MATSPITTRIPSPDSTRSNTINTRNPDSSRPRFNSNLPNLNQLLALLQRLLQQVHAQNPPRTQPLQGDWGGQGVGLNLNADGSGGNLRYGCAIGTIGPIKPDAQGNFTATGTQRHIGGIQMIDPDTGNPVENPPFPVNYTGKVRGNTMTLNVTNAADNSSLGSYTLKLGATPEIFYCA